MTEPQTSAREPEGLHARAIGWIGAAAVALVLGLTGVAWLLVEIPTGSPAAARPSSLEHDLFEQATGGAETRAAGTRALDAIDRAIDAVVADPTLIGGTR
ncbi:MAG: hypothetical protein ABI678_00870 [Kofleriaceae bacterium]